MEQLTLEQAAKNHSSEVFRIDKYADRKPVATIELAFKAGAEWQKENTKLLIQDLLGMEVWINDDEMKKLFADRINKLL